METLKNLYHNFPLLAKQSGYYFQLHRGRVNWSEIENLDVNEIIEKRNFELLEQNLVNVTNCNLDKEYDFKISDQNFLKLFKLAQLGVDYLSYCEMYLDRCVVLLQEKLIASQNDCELLRKEIHKRKEGNRNKSKSKALNYQCEKCAKVFISDVYLKFHERRRHSKINAPKNFDGSSQTCSCSCQQIEDKTKLSISTQTLFLDEEKSVTQETENAINIKVQDLSKVEKLEQELQDLKERLMEAENKLSEKAEALKSSTFYAANASDFTRYNLMLMLLSFYLTLIGNGCCEVNSGCQKPDPQDCKPNIILPLTGNIETFSSKLPIEDMSEVKSEFRISAEKKEELREKTTESTIPEIVKNFQKHHSEITEDSESKKGNINLKVMEQIFTNLTKPLPPPRKVKKLNQGQPSSDISSVVKRYEDAKEQTEVLCKHLIIRSTPVKNKQKEEIHSDIFEESIGNISEINMPKANSTESLQSKKSTLFESEPKSFIKKIVLKDSLSIQKLSKNFKKSLNSLCDSVSFTDKEVTKKETNFQNLKAVVINRLNNHLQQLGISSEWSGIPKKTLRQKLSSWKHQRKLLSQENPLYPVFRQNTEKKIFQKLSKNFGKKATSTNKLSKQESVNITGSEIQGLLFEDKAEFIKSRSTLLCDTDAYSESVMSDSIDFHVKKRNDSQKPVIVEEITSSEENDKEVERSIFLHTESSLNNLIGKSNKDSVSIDEGDKLLTDLDTDSSFIENFDQNGLKNFKKCPGNELTVGNDKIMENYENEKHHCMILCKCKGKEKGERQSILKEGEGFQSKSISNTHKKVLFATCSKSTEEELSDDPTSDDLWSLKTNWEGI